MTDLYPFFQAMRSTLKDLTEQINYQWEVKTPTTPCQKKLGGLNDNMSNDGPRPPRAGKA